MAISSFEVVIVGGGAAGIATAASLLKRRPNLRIAVVEPSDVHYYQPGWTMVGAGVFEPESTRRAESSVMPEKVKWLRAAAVNFAPEQNQLHLSDDTIVSYDFMIVATGLKLDWSAIRGLEESLGRNGVTSNYRYDLAPYTWELVRNLKKGRAIFTQPPMPIKCAGAPQKAMYLSCDAWQKQGVLEDLDVEFHNAGPVLFGIPTYVPALMKYVEAYGIDLNFGSKLTAVDGANRLATFATEQGEVSREFDMLHAVPPQVAPDAVRTSTLVNEAGWVEVDDSSLRHKRYSNVFALGDCGSTPNAKTAAAARKQAPIVAANICSVLDGKEPWAVYDGYGSCPLTVERGKIVLAEFGYGGKLLPSFPNWIIDGTRPQRLSWYLKSEALPWLYWNAMLKGREWLARPRAMAH